MSKELLVADNNIKVRKAKYLEKIINEFFNLIDEEEIIMESADYIVITVDCTE